MKNTQKANASITKPLLAGLVKATPVKLSNTNNNIQQPSLGKTENKQPDLTHDSGGGYNLDLSSIQD